MRTPFFLVDYFVWYYSSALRDLAALWLNFMWFIVYFFSIPLLLRTLFSPWRRMTDTYRRGSIEDLMSTFVMNVMTRVFGAMVRSVIILMGILFLLLGIVVFCIGIVTWLMMPVGSVFALLYGVNLLLI